MLSECICIESWWRDLEPSFACHYIDQSQPRVQTRAKCQVCVLRVLFSKALIKQGCNMGKSADMYAMRSSAFRDYI